MNIKKKEGSEGLASAFFKMICKISRHRSLLDCLGTKKESLNINYALIVLKFTRSILLDFRD
jgi:hypothetical protein